MCALTSILLTVTTMQQISYPPQPVFQGRRATLPKSHTDFALFLQWVPQSITSDSRVWQAALQLSAKELEFILGICGSMTFLLSRLSWNRIKVCSPPAELARFQRPEDVWIGKKGSG